jgi:lysophospholipase L1-like esterase
MDHEYKTGGEYRSRLFTGRGYADNTDECMGSKDGRRKKIQEWPWRVTPERAAAIDRLRKLAQASGSKFIVQFTPIPLEDGTPANADALRGWKALGSGLPLYDRSFFADDVHLNKSGAVQFTDELAGDVVKMLKG